MNPFRVSVFKLELWPWPIILRNPAPRGQHSSTLHPGRTREVTTPPGDPQLALIHTPPLLTSFCATSYAAARLAASRARAATPLAKALALKPFPSPALASAPPSFIA
jgi:hypothetical protein